MPRKAPTQVIEQRVTLGDLERSEVIPILNETRQLLKTGRVVTQVATYTTAAAAVLTSAGIAWAGYGVYSWFMEEGWFTSAKNWLKEDAFTFGPVSWFTTKKQEDAGTFEGPLFTPEGEKTYEQQMKEAGLM
tara:strand:- start:996 stop:1391 length:396 start_codon:yes stop_codon:yes gene_type:complete